MPKNPDLLAGWIAARTEHNDKQTADQVAVATAALEEAPDNMTEEKSWVGFFADDVGGLWTAANNIKAMLKQSAPMRLTLSHLSLHVGGCKCVDAESPEPVRERGGRTSSITSL